MIDLTNKTLDIQTNDIQILRKHYAPLLELIKPEQQLHYAFIFNVAFNYIKQKYSELNKDWKAWCILILKKNFNKINTDIDIINIIDDFIGYYHSEYQKYCDDLDSSGSDFDKESSFVYSYIQNKIGGQ